MGTAPKALSLQSWACAQSSLGLCSATPDGPVVVQEALKALHRACALLYTVWRQGLKITDREDHQELRRALPSLPHLSLQG